MNFEILNFTENVTKAQGVTSLMWVLHQELKTKVNSGHVFLAYPEKNIIFHIHGSVVKKKAIRSAWPSSESLNETWQVFLAKEFRRPFSWVERCALSQNEGISSKEPVLIFEHSFKEQSLKDFREFWDIRTRILSKICKTIFQIDELKENVLFWKRTFDHWGEPLALKRSGDLVYSNQAFGKTQDFHHFQEMIYPISWKQQNGVNVHSYKSIYKEKLLRAKIWQKEKMSVLGKKLEDISGSIKMSLSEIFEICEYWQGQMKTEDVREEDVRLLRQTVQRCQDVISNLMDFSKSESENVQFCIGEVASQTTRFLKTNLADRNFHCEIADEQVLVSGRPGLFSQVLFNLLYNACQATGDQEKIRLRIFSKGENALISVEDEGVGISENIQKNIFEPFFTTKKDGHGTGLGLYLCKKVVESFGGQIKVQSQKGKGTQFLISLPLVEAQSSEIAA